LALATKTRVWLTVAGILLFIAVILVSFVNRIQQPRVMTLTEMQINGLYIFDTPRDPGAFTLLDHRGAPFTKESLEGDWTLLFFGFTHCPDICPTTMSFLAKLKKELETTEAADTQVVMVTVDPARDTPEVLADYVPYFDATFTGVTGDFIKILSFARSFNAPFRKVTAPDGTYELDHSANVVLINPRGDYHGFFKAPLDLAKAKVTYRSARYLWED
jgi:protein SCO1/2